MPDIHTYTHTYIQTHIYIYKKYIYRQKQAGIRTSEPDRDKHAEAGKWTYTQEDKYIYTDQSETYSHTYIHTWLTDRDRETS